MKMLRLLRGMLRGLIGEPHETQRVETSSMYATAPLPIAVARGVSNGDEMGARVLAALGRIDDRGETWKDGLQYLDRIVITHSSIAEYWPVTRSCALGDSLVAGYPETALASIILHEAEHARLFSNQQWENLDELVNVEAKCTAKQLSFLEDQKGMAKYSEALKASQLNPRTALEAIRRRRLILFEQSDLPRWIPRLYRAMYRLGNSSASSTEVKRRRS